MFEAETPSVSTESETVTPESPAVEVSPQAESPEVAQPVVEEPPFTPNYKYKAYGKEFEVDEWARPLINKDNQDKLIKLYEKAGGFEPLKQRYESTTQELGTYKNAYTELDGARNTILSNIEKGDLASVFKMIGLNDQQIMGYVKQRLEYEGLPPEQRRAIDERNQLTQREQLYQHQLMEQQKYTESLIMQKHEMELTTNFNSPKYAPLIETYNSRMGDENAFRAAVERVGAYELAVNQKNISVPEAIEGAIRMLGLGGEQLPQQSMQAPGAQPMGQPQKPQPKPIVVPSGSSQSPIKKRPMSIADLEKERDQLINAN